MSRPSQISDKMLEEAKGYSSSMTNNQIAAKLGVRPKTLWERMNRAGLKALNGRMKQSKVKIAIERGELPNYIVFPGLSFGSLSSSQLARLKDTSANAELELICSCVCKYLDIDKKEMEIHCRERERVLARQIFFYLAYKLSGLPWKTIGYFMGKRDHTSAVHGGQVCKDMIDTDPDQARKVREIEGMIKNRMR